MIRKFPQSSSRKKSLGQGMTEYIIIVGVIAVAAIGVFGFFGDVVKDQTAGLASELAGGDGSQSQQNAIDSGEAAVNASGDHNDLSNYHANESGGAGTP